MNKVVLMGRLARDPEVRYSNGQNQTAIGRYTLAVDRRTRAQEGQPTADFISCVCFGKSAEFAEKYLKKGMRVVVCGRIQTGSYTNRDGQKVYTTDVVIEEQEFAESKSASTGGQASGGRQASAQGYQGRPDPGQAPGGFMDIPDGLDEELPFS